MKSFTTYKSERGKHQINRGLLWEYQMENFDWQKYRKIVAERVISMGRLSDWYGAFDLYGGIRGFRKIARDEVVDLSPRNLEFMCRALNIEITETRCYKQAQLRKAHLGFGKHLASSSKLFILANTLPTPCEVLAYTLRNGF